MGFRMSDDTPSFGNPAAIFQEKNVIYAPTLWTGLESCPSLKRQVDRENDCPVIVLLYSLMLSQIAGLL